VLDAVMRVALARDRCAEDRAKVTMTVEDVLWHETLVPLVRLPNPLRDPWC